MFLYKRDNDNEAGFPRRDGRLPSLPEPALRDALQDPGLYENVSSGCKDGLPLILSARFRNPFGFGLVGSGFHSFRWAFALALQKLLLIVGLTTAIPFLGCFPEFIWQLPFSHGSQALLSFLGLSLPACRELRGALPSALLLSIYLS